MRASHLSHLPIIGQRQPAEVQGMTIIVVVRCLNCEGGEDLALVNAQPAVCPSCGQLVSLDAVEWSKAQPVPRISLSATPPMAKA